MQSAPLQLNTPIAPSDVLLRLHEDVKVLLDHHHADVLLGLSDLVSQHWSSLGQLQETSMLATSHANFANAHVHEPDRYKHDDSGLIQVENPAVKPNKTLAQVGHLAMAKGWMSVATHNIHYNSSAAGRVSLLARQSNIDQNSKLQRFLASNMYKQIVGIIIVLNCIVLGMEADGLATHGKIAGWLEIANRGFVAIYALELGVRICVQRRAILEEDIYWTMFDALVVILALVEMGFYIYLDQSMQGRITSRSTILRVVKILRLARTLRAVKAMHFLRDLRLMIESITHSVRLLLWSVLLIFALTYVFGLVFTLAIAHDKKSEKNTLPSIVRSQHSSVLLQVMAILFETLFGGTSWSEFSRPLGRISRVYELLFMVFVIASNLVLLNVITGIVVQGSMSAAYKDRDLVIQEQFELSNSTMGDLISLFAEADLDNEGKLSRKELDTFVNDERVAAFLKHLDVEISEAIGLFELLDSNGDGFVDVHEFTVGCMRLKGPAKNIDVATMLFEHKKILRSLRMEFAKINDGIDNLKKLCNKRSHELILKSRRPLTQNSPSQGLPEAWQRHETMVQENSEEPMPEVVEHL